MENNKFNDEKSKFALNQYEYEQIKDINKKALGILLEYVKMVEREIEDFYKECGGFQALGKAYDNLSTMKGLFYRNYKKIEIGIDFTIEQHIVEQKNGIKEIIRYYYNDVYSVITNPIQEQKLTLKKYSKKILMKLGNPQYHKRFVNERASIKRKLDKLQFKKENLIV